MRTDYCDQCGTKIFSPASFCTKCGAILSDTSIAAQEVATPSITSTTNWQRYWPVGFGAVGVLVLLALALDNSVNKQFSAVLMISLLWASPLIASALVFFAKPIVFLAYFAGFDRWLLARKEKAAARDTFFNTFVSGPVYWGYAKLIDWTGGIGDDFLRCAVKLAAYLYFLGIVLYLLYIVTVLVIALALLALGVMIFSEIMGQGKTSTSGGAGRYIAPDEPERNDGLMQSVGSGEGTAYSGSNWFTEEKIGRTDAEGNIYQGENWFTEEKTGRVDAEGSIMRGANWLTEERAGRIDDKGNIYKGSNWISEEKVGRIDEKGNVFEGSNWHNEKKVGRVEKKE